MISSREESKSLTPRDGSADYIFKVILVGDSGVGKTSILLRYTENIFSEGFVATIGVDFKIKTIPTRGDTLSKLQVWDTAGQERFKHLVSSFYRNADSIVIVFDVTNQVSFQNVQEWAEEARRFRDINQCLLFIIGNKSDLDDKRVVSSEEGQKLADALNAQYVEASAKNAENIHGAFEEMVHKLVDIRKEEELQNPKQSGDRVVIGGKPYGEGQSSSCLCS